MQIQLFQYPGRAIRFKEAFKINDNGFIRYIWPENIHKRSQDLLPAYHDAGQFCWINVNSFLNNKFLITDKTTFIELDELIVQDIDNESDWEIAEMKYSLMKKNNHDFQRLINFDGQRKVKRKY